METTGEIEASMDMVVGGNAYATWNHDIVFTSRTTDKRGNHYTVADVELIASNCPGDWRIFVGERVYRRHDGKWKCLN